MNRLSCSVLLICFAGQAGLANPLGQAYQVGPVAISLIPPGTVISERAPHPWTHLIIKSQPRVAAGDIQAVSQHNHRLAGLFFTCLLARVEPVGEGGNQRFRLGDVAGGIGTRIADRDTVVSPTTYGRLGARIGLLGRMVLAELQKKQQSVQVILRSPTLLAFDTPIVIRTEHGNREMVLRYAVVLDGQTGRLDTLTWLIETDQQQRYLSMASRLQWLAPDKLEDCLLHVDSSEYFVGIPSHRAYAVVHIPQGQSQIDLPPKGAQLLIHQTWNQEQAPIVDQYLRDILRFAQDNLHRGREL